MDEHVKKLQEQRKQAERDALMAYLQSVSDYVANKIKYDLFDYFKDLLFIQALVVKKNVFGYATVNYRIKRLEDMQFALGQRMNGSQVLVQFIYNDGKEMFATIPAENIDNEESGDE